MNLQSKLEESGVVVMLSQMELEGKSHKECLLVLREIQKLRNSL